MLSLGRKIKLIKFTLLNICKNNFYFFYKILILISCIFKFIKIILRKKTNVKYSLILDEINKNEFRKFSQNNEDGIIEYILKKIGLKKVNFIEIGFDFYENNSLNLFRKCEKGLLIDSDSDKCFMMKAIIFIFFFFKNITVINSKINKNNVNKLIIEKFGNDEVDILSIDIDGLDLYILQALEIKPKIIVIEYNFWLGPDKSLSIPYDENFIWKKDLYGGASLLAMCKIANKKDYYLIATDSSCVNAFFIHKDYRDSFEILDPRIKFKQPSRYTKKDFDIAKKFFEDKIFNKI